MIPVVRNVSAREINVVLLQLNTRMDELRDRLYLAERAMEEIGGRVAALEEKAGA